MGERAIARRAGRILLLDAAGRVLLFRGFDPARVQHRYWFTPGGGLNPGESPADGAARELREETGLRLPSSALGAPVWREVTEFPFDGRWYRQEQQFFVVRVADWDVVTDGFNTIERGSIDGFRWWTVEELAATKERYYPVELVDLLRQVREGA